MRFIILPRPQTRQSNQLLHKVKDMSASTGIGGTCLVSATHRRLLPTVVVGIARFSPIEIGAGPQMPASIKDFRLTQTEKLAPRVRINAENWQLIFSWKRVDKNLGPVSVKQRQCRCPAFWAVIFAIRKSGSTTQKMQQFQRLGEDLRLGMTAAQANFRAFVEDEFAEHRVDNSKRQSAAGVPPTG
jgi:hypothetical protein